MNSEVTLEQLRELYNGQGAAYAAYDSSESTDGAVLDELSKAFCAASSRYDEAVHDYVRQLLTTPPASGEVVGDIAQMIVEMRNFADVADHCQLTEGNAGVSIRCWADRLSAAPKQAMGWRAIATDAMVAAYLKEYQAEFEAAYERLLTNPEERSPIQDACRKGIAAALAASPSGWLDIAIAPKDGTAVLCYWPGCIMNGRDYEGQVGIAYTALSGQWFDADGGEFGDPTHFQYLPSPPEKAGV